MAMSMQMTVFCVEVLCSLVQVYQRFGDTYCLITLIAEAVSTSEMLVNFCQTSWWYNLKDSHLQMIMWFYVFIGRPNDGSSSS
jgi:hypothetical protein